MRKAGTDLRYETSARVRGHEDVKVSFIESEVQGKLALSTQKKSFCVHE